MRFDCANKFLESLGILCHGRIVIRVIVFQMGDDGDGRVQTQEHAVVLISFNDEFLAGSGMGVGFRPLINTTHDDTMDLVPVREHPGNHR